ncbi:hypothetical protein AAZX31_18G150000 [Glycine max]
MDGYNFDHGSLIDGMCSVHLYFIGIMGSSEGCSRESEESGFSVRDPTKEVFEVSSDSDSLGSYSTNFSTFLDSLSEQVVDNITHIVDSVFGNTTTIVDVAFGSSRNMKRIPQEKRRVETDQ